MAEEPDTLETRLAMKVLGEKQGSLAELMQPDHGPSAARKVMCPASSVARASLCNALADLRHHLIRHVKEVVQADEAMGHTRHAAKFHLHASL